MSWRELTPKTARAAEVEWEDIVMVDNWNESVDPTTIEVVTVGWILQSDPKQVMVASTYNYGEDAWATIHVIPAGAVTRVRYLDGCD